MLGGCHCPIQFGLPPALALMLSSGSCHLAGAASSTLPGLFSVQDFVLALGYCSPAWCDLPPVLAVASWCCSLAQPACSHSDSHKCQQMLQSIPAWSAPGWSQHIGWWLLQTCLDQPPSHSCSSQKGSPKVSLSDPFQGLVLYLLAGAEATWGIYSDI